MVVYQDFHKQCAAKIVFNINNNKNYWAPNQYIRMISEGSFDTEHFAIMGINYLFF